MPTSLGFSFSAGPMYTNAIMGQAISAQAREQALKAGSSILREDSVHVEELETPRIPSRPDSWSMH